MTPSPHLTLDQDADGKWFWSDLVTRWCSQLFDSDDEALIALRESTIKWTMVNEHGYVISMPCEHDWVEGFCSQCGEKQPS